MDSIYSESTLARELASFDEARLERRRREEGLLIGLETRRLPLAAAQI